jgi:glycopeptide antibiotics resistance protein
VLSILAALAADYPWGDFQGHTHWGNVRWIPFVTPPISAGDIAQNVLLFLPLGVFIGMRARFAVAACSLAGGVAVPVALLGEWTQVYSHSRFPSGTDAVSNVIGAVLGAALAAWMWRPSGRIRQP